MIIDHMGLDVTDFDKSMAFYTAALAPLGIEALMHFDVEGRQIAGFGRGGKPEFWIAQGERTTPKIHVAFGAENRGLVDAFYKAALQAGGVDNGAPGIREIYHPAYYGAFVLDPDGHNIEAVCHHA